MFKGWKKYAILSLCAIFITATVAVWQFKNPRIAEAAIAYETASEGPYSQAAGTSITWNHTITTGDLLVVCVSEDRAVNGGAVTGVTYNGSAMTMIARQDSNPSNNIDLVSMWYKLAPASGTHAIVVSASANMWELSGVAASYSGTKQTGQPDAFSSNATTSGSSLTGTVTTIADNSWVVACGGDRNHQRTAGSGTTKRVEQTTGSIPYESALFDSNGAITPAGSKSLSFSWSGTSFDGIVIASFSPPSVAVATPAIFFAGD